MKVGTKSILFGAHQFFIHPIFVFIAWWILYGFPLDPRLWIAFFVHDLGYWGKPNMDGPEGEQHPVYGANIMYFLGYKWYELCLFHSRFLAKKYNCQYSKLCVADKLAVSLEPWWLYLPRVIMSGEIKEYMKIADLGDRYSITFNTVTRRMWFDSTTEYMKMWAYEHRNLKRDNWTPESGVKSAKNSNGTYK